jgi:CheY-like chemotaxis protein
MGQSMNKPMHALIVDDESAIRHLTVKALKGYDFFCEEAEDGKQALEMLSRHSYDVVVTDLDA